jgi:putative membrane protein (TIGR04086 family)
MAGELHPMTSPPGRIVWLAVLAGFFVDNLISLVITLIAQRLDPQLAQGLNFASTVGIVTTALLTLSTGFGGWLAGRLAKHEYVLHGALVGGISLLTLLIDALFVMSPALFSIVHAIVLVGVGALGGLLSRWIPSSQKQL